jgi:predicted XRE-type DNA-binding protein
MKTRCDNPKNEFYADYGGRGITYCDKWKTFEGFWEDMAEGYSDDLTLNRRRVNENYCKENCEWDDKSYQGHQRRKMKGCSISVIGGTLDTRNMKMYARIRYKDESLHLGDYETEEEIAEAYDHASEFFYNDRPNGTILTRPSVAARVQHFLDNRDKNLNPKGSNHKMAKLTDDDVREIWKLLQEGEVKQSDIAKRFGVLQANISVINRGEGWNHITSLPIKRRKNRRKKAKETKHG